MYIDEKKLYLMCAKRQMTVKELIRKAGVTYQILTAVKKGWRSTTKTVGKLAAALECEPQELLKDEV